MFVDHADGDLLTHTHHVDEWRLVVVSQFVVNAEVANSGRHPAILVDASQILGISQMANHIKLAGVGHMLLASQGNRGARE